MPIEIGKIADHPNTRPTDELVSDLLALAPDLRLSAEQLLSDAAKRLDSLQTQLVVERDERAKLATEAVPRKYQPSDFELRMQAMHAAASAGEQAPETARYLYRFLTDSPELPPRDRYEIDMDLHEDEDNGRHLERTLGEAIGAASMAWSQTPRGVFDSSHAASIVQELVAYVRSHVEGMADMLVSKALDDPDASVVSQARIDAETATWDAKGYTQEHDDEHGREHVLIQAMQYAIKGRHVAALALLERAAMTPTAEPQPDPRAAAWVELWQIVGGGELTDLASAQQRIIDRLRDGEPKPPAHGLAVGDVLSAEQAVAAPVGTKFTDKDGDETERVVPGGYIDRLLSWPTFGRITPQKYAPYTITELPEPTEVPE